MDNENAKQRNAADPVRELRDQIEKLRADFQEQTYGGTEKTPIGFDQRLRGIERTLNRIDGDGELRQLLATVDVETMRQVKALLDVWGVRSVDELNTQLALISDNKIRRGQSRVDALERGQAVVFRILWALGTAVVLGTVNQVLKMVNGG